MRKVLRPLAPLACALVVLVGAGTASAADRYVALGDSYSSGVGTGSYTLDSRCLRGTYAYPYLASRARPNTDLVFVACSGATTTSLMSTQISAVTADTDLVSVTIGGNDAGFSDVIVSCVTLGCSSAITTARNFIATQLAGRLDTVYSAIARQAPNARVAVLGYPRLFGSSGCFSTTGISAGERSDLNAVADQLRDVIRARAVAHGFTFVDAIPVFLTHPVCSSEWINGINIINTTESFHPNRPGNSSGYLPMVRSVIG